MNYKNTEQVQRHAARSKIKRLVKWSLLLLPVLAACFLSGCRLFTVGG